MPRDKEYPDNWGVKFYPDGETPEQALTRRGERKKRVPRHARRRVAARRMRKRY